ncbi:MAG: trypsin-like peptidase domain-containing protein [Actinomycetota bacterium]
MDAAPTDNQQLSAGSPVGGGPTRPAALPLGGPEPIAPPQRPRPDAMGPGPAPASAPTAPPVRPEPVASNAEGDQPLIAATPGWGWRTFLAFLAGGALTAGGFAVGSRSDDVAATAETTPTSISAPLNTADRTAASQPPITLARDGTVEPAQLVAELLGPSVVQIETGTGIGSGVIYGDGLVMTNHHVVGNVSDLTVVLKNGRKLQGEVVGSEPNVDVAVIDLGPGLGLPQAELATGEKAQVGQTAIAIGSPFQLQQSVTEGIVSAVDRPVPSGQFYTAMIQTDAPINPGNSGGALADRFGRVIGINTAIQTGGFSNTNAGVGFAIPIDTAVSVADRLVAGEPIIGGFLGVEGGPPGDGAAGVEVGSITPGSGAETSGLEVGDRILSVDGAPVTAFEELAGLVVAREPGDVVELEVVRDEEVLVIEATLGQR